MRIFSAKLVTTGLLLAVLPAAFAKPRPHSKTHASVKPGARLHKSVKTNLGGMPTERATEIQTALIKQGYLTGEPSGTWDSQTAAAMSKLQGDNGWQTKITPDARGLNKLGLGAQASTTDPVTTTK